MSQVIALCRREMYGLMTQRWILILLALLAMELLIGVGVRINNVPTIDLGNVAVIMCFLGSLAVMGLSLDAVTKERTSGSLDLMLTRPVSRRQVLAGKLLAYLVISLPVGVLGLFLPMAVAGLLGSALDLTTYPVELVVAATLVYLALFSLVGVAISLFCRSLQSAFAVGGALWAFLSPLVWQFLVLRGLSRQISEEALAWLNTLNPMGAFYSAIQYRDGMGMTSMGPGLSTWTAFLVMGLEVVVIGALALLLFDRQEEPGYQA